MTTQMARSLKPSTWFNSSNGLVLASIGGLLLLIPLWKILPVHDYLQSALEWVSSTGPAGVVAFCLVYVIVALIGIPRTPLHIAAGVIFSFPMAMLAVLSSALCAYVLTFSIARTVARDWVRDQVAKSGNIERLLKLVDEEGFKIVLLIRMNLLVPGVLKGYGFGTTNIGFGTYLGASMLGFLPIALAHVYLGWAGGEVMLQEGGSPSQLEKGLLIGGVLLSIAMVAGTYYIGKRALSRQYAAEDKS